MRTNSESDKTKYNVVVRQTRESIKKMKKNKSDKQCKKIHESFDVARTMKAFGLIKNL